MCIANNNSGEWKPQIVEKMYILPAKQLKKVLSNDFKSSSLAAILNDKDIKIKNRHDKINNLNEAVSKFNGEEKIELQHQLIIEKKDYGLGISCGGSVLKYNNQIYRSYEGGIAPLETNLEIRSTAKIGSYEPSQVYSTEIIDEYIYFGITNYSDLNQVKVIDENGNEINSFEVGIIPGDFAIWKSE